MIRTYKLQHHINKGKQDTIRYTIKLYRETATVIAKHLWLSFYKDAKPFNKNTGIKHIASPLSERYKQTCLYQTVSILNSFISNMKNEFIKTVYNSKLPEDVKFKLFTINKYGLWYKKKLDKIDANTLALARKIFTHILSKHRKPSFKHISMHLDRKVALISSKVPDKASSFDYWIRLSTHEKRCPLYLPLTTNRYFDSIDGKLKHFCQIGLDRDNNLTVSLLKNIPDERNTYRPIVDKISIDIGLKTLFASDKGDLFGRQFFEVLSDFDRRITVLAANRQRQGLKVKSRKYRKLTNSLRCYLKNEINRCLNRIVELYSPAEIVIERLNFNNPRLSKRMNRLIRIFGLSVIRSKLESLQEQFGIKITETNPAYSSQECSECGYTDKANRVKQEIFACKFCGTSLQADVNGARNHHSRSSDMVIDIYKRKKAVLYILVKRFVESLSDIERKYSMPHSKAMDLLLGNPYFKDVLPSIV